MTKPKKDNGKEKAPPPRRTTVTLDELAERIIKLRDDSAWLALTLPQKIRLLLEEYVAIIEERNRKTKSKEDKPKTLAELVRRHFWLLQKANIKNIAAIADGATASKADVVRIASVLDMEEDYVQALADKVKGEEKNGCAELS